MSRQPRNTLLKKSQDRDMIATLQEGFSSACKADKKTQKEYSYESNNAVFA